MLRKEKRSVKMKKSICLLLTLSVILVLVSAGMAAAKKPAPSLEGTTEYIFVGSGPPDAEGRTLVWEGPISGDIEGVIQWWIDMDTMTKTGAVSHYDDRWVILDKNKAAVLLAGEESGSTTARDGKDSIWRTNGVVTDASDQFEGWIGRQTHADGNAEFPPGELPSGEGTFRIN
jgi:hypothetical protein